MRPELTRVGLLVKRANHYTSKGAQRCSHSNLRSSLHRCGTRPNEWGAQ